MPRSPRRSRTRRRKRRLSRASWPTSTPPAVTSREALAKLPVTRKSELAELQKAARPFGGLAATRWGRARRCSPRPAAIYEPEGAAPDYWRLARALFAAGFRAGDLVHNCFSYHSRPRARCSKRGAHALGCTVLPGGTGQTEMQVAAMADLRPAGYVGTPSFLKLIVEKADELGVEAPSLKKALVSRRTFPPSLRKALRSAASSDTRCTRAPTSA